MTHQACRSYFDFGRLAAYAQHERPHLPVRPEPFDCAQDRLRAAKSKGSTHYVRRSKKQAARPAWKFIEILMIRDKPNPFALSLSKGVVTQEGFDKLSPNGVMGFRQINNIDRRENER